jgi:hypothetical protein
MPNRIIREGILTSERFENLTWAEEVFYRRIMSVVDDYGRYYAKPALLRAACYPLLLQKVSDSDIEKWLTACVNSALVRVYPAKDGKRYLEVNDFRQQVRSNASKFPAYDEQMHSTCVADATHMKSFAHLDGDVSVVVDEGAIALNGQSAAIAPKNSKKKLPDEEWLSEIKANYSHVNLDVELGKIDAWLSVNPGRQKTRKFVLNWLNRIDAPLGKTEVEEAPFPYQMLN